MPEFGVIGGSGVSHIPGLEIRDEVAVETPCGAPSDIYRIGMLAGREIAFLARHGSGHTLPPQRINYRANILGFRQLGVKRLLSVGAVGGISSEMSPGLITFPDQLIDQTSGRMNTFYDQNEVVHIDFTEPFCEDLRGYLLRAAERAAVPAAARATYICVNGPRLETAAEIRTFAGWGADIIGMTAMPEAGLAREAEICYAGISVVTNYAAGRAGERLTTAEVKETMQRSEEKIRLLLLQYFKSVFQSRDCTCGQALAEARM
ncbi:MAG: S-methyl-5'-thioadenosine phosphorylase [Thermodesulfovibrio sp.]|nr:S-methyl-5'-thioadenosine phosphorylase [Thermodesulfovibrio sp.]